MAKEKVKVTMDYNLKSHIIGKIWMALAMLIFFAVPTTICLYFDVKPDMSVMGTIAVIVPFLINFLSGVFEPIIYSPMLGINSAYLAFITGNLSNLKIPCVVKAQEICGTKLGTEENEVVSTLSVATSTLVTTVIIAVFVLILAVSNVETAIKNTPGLRLRSLALFMRCLDRSAENTSSKTSSSPYSRLSSSLRSLSFWDLQRQSSSARHICLWALGFAQYLQYFKSCAKRKKRNSKRSKSISNKSQVRMSNSTKTPQAKSSNRMSITRMKNNLLKRRKRKRNKSPKTPKALTKKQLKA